MTNKSQITNHKSLFTNHQSLQNSIVLHNVSKKYNILKDRPILLKRLLSKPKSSEHWALKDVSLSIERGECVGIIGENGSGKSTLLKIISGITTPTYGEVKVSGRVCSLIELGAGFHPDLSGRENVYLNAILLGLTKKEIERKYKDIVDFADIGEFIDQPVRTYSSGMVVRLGFSVAIHLDPEILLIDEVLSVGDEEFQRKCIKKIREFNDNVKTIILVSHDLTLIASLCNKAIWMQSNIVKFTGKTSQAIKRYLSYVDVNNNSEQRVIKKRWGSKKAVVTSISSFYFRDRIKIRITTKFNDDVKDPVFGITIRNSKLENIYFTNTHLAGSKTGNFKKGEERVVDFILESKLIQETYFISPAIAAYDLSEFYDWRENYGSLKINGITAFNKNSIMIHKL